MVIQLCYISDHTSLLVSAYLMRFVIAANLLGFPAISVPVSYTQSPLEEHSLKCFT